MIACVPTLSALLACFFAALLGAILVRKDGIH